MFTLANCCLTTSFYLDSWTKHSRFLCNTVLYSIGLYFHHQTHPQLGVVSTLAQPLHSFCSFFSALRQQYIEHPPICGAHLSVSYFFFFYFSYCPWVSQGKNTEVVGHSLPQWTTFCQKSPPCPVHRVGPCMAPSFTELHKVVIHMIILVSFL